MVRSGRVANLRRELEKFLQRIEKIKAVIEAGRPSYTMVDVLDNMGIEIAVVHPKDVKAIAGESFFSAGVASEGLLRGEADSGEEPAAGASGTARGRGSLRGCSGGGSFHGEGDEGARRSRFAGGGGEDGGGAGSDLCKCQGLLP